MQGMWKQKMYFDDVKQGGITGVKHPRSLLKNLKDVTRAETSTYEVMFLRFIHV